MKKTWLVILAIGGAAFAVYWFLIRGKSAVPSSVAAKTNTNSAGFLDSYFQGFNAVQPKITNTTNQTGTILTGVGNAFTGITSGLSKLFSGKPTTSAATPIKTPAAQTKLQPTGYEQSYGDEPANPDNYSAVTNDVPSGDYGWEDYYSADNLGYEF